MGVKAWILKHKNAIVEGIIVSLITAIIVKIAGFIINSAPSASGTFFKKCVDMIYYFAGRMSPMALVTMLFSVAISLFYTYTFIIIFRSFRIIMNDEKTKKVEKKLDVLEQKEKDDPDFLPLLLKAKRLNEKTKKTIERNKQPNNKKMKVFLILSTIIIIFFVVHIFVYDLVPATMWNKFEISITAISPYVDDENIKSLRSKWVTMNSQDDYEEIANFIDNIKEENGLN